MNIGKVYKNKKGNIILDMQVPFRTKESFLIVQNKEKKQEKEPDFVLFGLYGKIGAVWNKISEKNVEYKSATIEMAELINGKYEVAKFHFTLFKNDDENKKEVLYRAVFSGSTQQDRQTRNDDEARTPDESYFPDSSMETSFETNFDDNPFV